MAGSRAAQLAKEEADRVEAEDAADEVTVDEATGEILEVERIPGADDPPVSAEEGMRRLEALLTRHEDGLRELFGADFDGMSPCSFCNGFGFSDQPTLQHHPDKERCPKCGGHGALVSGSLNPSFATIACEGCQGNGYVTKAPPMPPIPQQPQNVIYVDPLTGLPVQPQPQQQPLPADGTWAPGYQPGGQPVPVHVPQS